MLEKLGGVYVETLLSNFLGAFFGFLFAIIIEIWVSRKSDKDIQNKIKTNIKNELEEIRDGLLKIKGNNENPLYFRYSLEAPSSSIRSIWMIIY